MKRNNYKKIYNAPAVESLSVRVEAGMQSSVSGTPSNTTQYNADSWDTPNPTNSPEFS